MAKRDGCVEVPFGLEGLGGGAYLMSGQPERYVEWCRSYLDLGRDTHGLTRSALVNALVFAGSAEEAIIAADGLVDVAEATGNPWAISYALLSTAWAYRDADPLFALQVARRGLATTRETGNRFNWRSGITTIRGALPSCIRLWSTSQRSLTGSGTSPVPPSS